jgi:hypothetical protein
MNRLDLSKHLMPRPDDITVVEVSEVSADGRLEVDDLLIVDRSVQPALDDFVLTEPSPGLFAVDPYRPAPLHIAGTELVESGIKTIGTVTAIVRKLVSSEVRTAAG